MCKSQIEIITTHIPILAPENRRLDIAVTQHAPSHPRKRDILPEKDASNLGRDMSKSVPHAPDDKVLEGGGLLDKCGLIVCCDEVALIDEFFGELEDYFDYLMYTTVSPLVCLAFCVCAVGVTAF